MASTALTSHDTSMAELKDVKIRVLVVDDSSMQRKLCRHTLHATNLNLDVHLADSPAMTMDTIRHNVFDVIFVDMNLSIDPEAMDGCGLIELIRSTPSDSQSCIIVGMSTSIHKYADAMRQSGASFSLAKPFPKPAELSSLLEQLLAQKDLAALSKAMQLAAKPKITPAVLVQFPLSSNSRHILIVETASHRPSLSRAD